MPNVNLILTQWAKFQVDNNLLLTVTTPLGNQTIQLDRPLFTNSGSTLPMNMSLISGEDVTVSSDIAYKLIAFDPVTFRKLEGEDK